jgi:hypothetical protein
MLPFTIFILSFTIFFFAFEISGIFYQSSPSSLDVLYATPFLAASLLLFLVTLIHAIKNVRRMKTEVWMRVLAVVLFVSGLWVSHLTRFSAEVVLTEGQSFHTQQGDYDPGSVYMGRFARVPDTGIKLENLQPSFSDNGKRVVRLEGSVQMIDMKDGETEDYVLRDGLPKLIKGTFMKLKDFGYSPRYALKSKEGRVLDSSFIYMRLFPPGSEDSFRLLSPLTYHVRYYPAEKDGGSDPVFRLRIVRNKDIVFNDTVQLAEDISFENSRIAIEEVRMWTKLTIVRDWGGLIAFTGLALGVPGFAAGFMRKKKAKA